MFLFWMSHWLPFFKAASICRSRNLSRALTSLPTVSDRLENNIRSSFVNFPLEGAGFEHSVPLGILLHSRALRSNAND